jgi:hypothetical protein
MSTFRAALVLLLIVGGCKKSSEPPKTVGEQTAKPPPPEQKVRATQDWSNDPKKFVEQIYDSVTDKSDRPLEDAELLSASLLAHKGGIRLTDSFWLRGSDPPDIYRVVGTKKTKSGIEVSVALAYSWMEEKDLTQPSLFVTLVRESGRLRVDDLVELEGEEGKPRSVRTMITEQRGPPNTTKTSNDPRTFVSDAYKSYFDADVEVPFWDHWKDIFTENAYRGAAAIGETQGCPLVGRWGEKEYGAKWKIANVGAESVDVNLFYSDSPEIVVVARIHLLKTKYGLRIDDIEFRGELDDDEGPDILFLSKEYWGG